MSNDFIEQKRMAGQKGGIASGNNRKIKLNGKNTGALFHV